MTELSSTQLVLRQPQLDKCTLKFRRLVDCGFWKRNPPLTRMPPSRAIRQVLRPTFTLPARQRNEQPCFAHDDRPQAESPDVSEQLCAAGLVGDRLLKLLEFGSSCCKGPWGRQERVANGAALCCLCCDAFPDKSANIYTRDLGTTCLSSFVARHRAIQLLLTCRLSALSESTQS